MLLLSIKKKNFVITNGNMRIQQKNDIQKSDVDGKGMDIPIGIGDDTQIRKAIVDTNARIGRNVMVGRIISIATY